MLLRHAAFGFGLLISVSKKVLQKTAWVRKDNTFDTLLGRNFRKLFCDFDGFFQPPKFIDKSVGFRLVAHPDMALANGIDVLRVFAPTLSYLWNEFVVIGVFNLSLELGRLFGGKFLGFPE